MGSGRSIPVLGLTALALGLSPAGRSAGADPASGPPGSPGPAESITIVLRPYAGNLVTVPAVAGRDTLRLLLDTGGGVTLVTPEVASRLGCTPHGRSVGYRMSGEPVTFGLCDDVPLSIGGVAFPHPELAVWDLMSILPAGLPPLDGVLALKTFRDRPITLDLAARTLTLETATSLAERIRTMTPVEVRVATGLTGGDRTLFVRGVLDQTGWFLLDSGNLDRIQVAPHMVHAEGPVPRTLDAVPFTIPGIGPTEVPVRVADILYDGALSESFLREWVWTFDPESAALWARRKP